MVTEPIFPYFRELTLSDRPQIQYRLQEYQPQTSELTFTNLYIWRSYYRTIWSLLDNWLILINRPETSSPYAFVPIGPPPRIDIIEKVLHWMAKEFPEDVPQIQRADEKTIAELSNANEFSIREEREHFDYVYSTSKLIDLSGRKLHRKRNFIKRFKNAYNWSYEKITEQNIDDCIRLTDSWCQMKSCVEDMSLFSEWDGIRDALRHFKTLELTGGAILVDNTIQGFSFGELLNNHMAVIHVEKANAEFMGIYPTLNQEFALNEWQSIPYINREQDLGNEGLRRAKESYYPDSLTKKFSIKLIKSEENDEHYPITDRQQNCEHDDNDAGN